MIAQLGIIPYTTQEYLALEEKAEFRHEYINGAIIPMTGGTARHNRLTLNVAFKLVSLLEDQPYEVFANDLRLWIPEKRIYTYPDVMVVAGDLAFHEDRNDTITNPVLIIEVLSKSTSSYDRGEKFSFYRTISTLQEYMLIEQDKVEINIYRKQDNNEWRFTALEEMNHQLNFSSIPARISVADIYKSITFSQ